MGPRSSSIKIWGWAVTRRRCLNGSIIPVQATTRMRTCIVGLSVLCQGQPDSGEGCIMLQILCCRGRTLWTRLWTHVCKPLMPDVVVPKVHQNNCSYVSSVDLPSDSLCKNLAWWAVTWRTLKNYQNWGVGTCPGMGADKSTLVSRVTKMISSLRIKVYCS